MTLTIKLMVVLALGLASLTPQAGAQETQPFKTHKDKISYVAGVEMATTLKTQGMEVNMDLFVKGLQDAFSGGKLLLSDDEIRKASAMFHAELRQKQNETRRNGEATVEAEENKKRGCIRRNKTRRRRHPARQLRAGSSRRARARRRRIPTVEVMYRGTLIDGTQFDSSREQPRARSTVIPGTEALKQCLSAPVSSSSSPAAYLRSARDPVVGPNSTSSLSWTGGIKQVPTKDSVK
jgi:FKBP-type peptidyl-prolyl cis-trans isomerase FklB